jgi:hypothetical protein
MVVASHRSDRGGWLHGAVPRWHIILAAALFFAAQQLVRLSTTVAGPSAAAAAKHGGLPAPPEAVFGGWCWGVGALRDGELARCCFFARCCRQAGACCCCCCAPPPPAPQNVCIPPHNACHCFSRWGLGFLV